MSVKDCEWMGGGECGERVGLSGPWDREAAPTRRCATVGTAEKEGWVPLALLGTSRSPAASAGFKRWGGSLAGAGKGLEEQCSSVAALRVRVGTTLGRPAASLVAQRLPPKKWIIDGQGPKRWGN